MRTFLLAAGAAIAALGLADCNRSGGQNPPSAATAEEKAATPSAHPGATVLSADDETKAPTFTAKAAASDQFEIQASKLALQRSSNPEVKRFARMMIDAHTKTTAQLKQAADDAGVAIPTPVVLPSDMQGKLNDLEKVSLADFDKTYLDDVVDAHQSALNVMQRYAQDGDQAQIKSLAAEVAPKVQQHLTMAKSIKDDLAKGAGGAAEG